MSNGGAVGAAGGPPGVGGASNGGGGGLSGAGGTVMYPPIAASQLGMPTRVAATTALTLAEGPLWDPCAHRLLFADVTASKIYSLAIDGGVSVFASNTGNTNGIAFDIDGSLILAQMGGAPGHISRRDKMGTITPLEPAGTRLHTPDDVVVRSDGAIYFTDGDFPPIGSIDLAPLPVYVLKHGATTLSNGGSVPGPNGVELSPDEKTLYVDSYNQGAVIQYAVAPDGSITKGAALATGLTNADSLCVDAAGNLYVGVSTGLQVLRPDGSKVALIRIQSTQGVTNCEFGGDDGKTLYITAWTTVWQITGMPIPGLQWSVNRVRLGCM
jgi:gluconolactonase